MEPALLSVLFSSNTSVHNCVYLNNNYNTNDKYITDSLCTVTIIIMFYYNLHCYYSTLGILYNSAITPCNIALYPDTIGWMPFYSRNKTNDVVRILY